jgi:hypothetical protein
MKRWIGGAGLVGLALACGSPEQRQEIVERQAAEKAARDAAPAEAQALLQERRADLVAIGAQLADPPAESACDPAAISAIASDGDRVWRAPAAWLQAASESGEEAGDAQLPSTLSLEPQLVYRRSPSETYADRDRMNWAETVQAAPPLLAVLHVTSVREPAGVWEGAAFVPGSFEPGVLQGTLSLWDVQGRALLCATPVSAQSSDSVQVGGMLQADAETVVSRDFEAQVDTGLQAGLDRLAPGLIYR